MSEKRTPISDYDFDLPEELIAQYPAEKRGTSKLLVVNGEALYDKIFTDIVDLIDENSFLVINTTKVMKARLYGTKPTGGQVEILVLEKTSERICTAITKGKVKEGTVVNIPPFRAVITEILDDGSRVIEFDTDVSDVMDKCGHMPLPPYITREDTKKDTDRYQTIYSKDEGSVAAPTAGLHFTPEIMNALKAKGIEVLEVTLNIGIGTFRPVKADYLEDHDMHTEKYYISEETSDRINSLLKEGKKLVAVGTTAVRALESAAENGEVQAGYGETKLFIKPGYDFKVISSLITNFHLPKSTLFVLVSQLAGRRNMLNAYEHAKANGYKFFSYGDAMFISTKL
ncbi:S-adenosylmethionine/ tRNA-ribosyltransferase-isomerase [Denitrovibrio acetiphilus DSM 12809]|uniref:S-adenosylmethionine:tRNA ribosyltransferase-isomerase n=1 Tax=Denitrovibrio acetiphilus (strain DSM 12809 / NBRC 114555 / N2460) TaxID=522772 RepID=D4H486_DENA2|nr:tRNA preQ1(34) S-adenosylmethionine ribosyltransferase-isomerase QueA [Denitrovibrio acetiphilus]ADD69215.1 S-adenosylmethionine/ tRNA-ribosyltransferase-isomerase [Denitrovibrio acetiphilus DSM 12809]